MDQHQNAQNNQHAIITVNSQLYLHSQQGKKNPQNAKKIKVKTQNKKKNNEIPIKLNTPWN